MLRTAAAGWRVARNGARAATVRQRSAPTAVRASLGVAGDTLSGESRRANYGTRLEHQLLELSMEGQFAAMGITAVFGISAIMLKMWLGHVEKMKGLSNEKPDRSVSDARLERLEQAVESIAIEIERVSEGQRFVTKLMSEKAQPMLREALPVPTRVQKVDTPH